MTLRMKPMAAAVLGLSAPLVFTGPAAATDAAHEAESQAKATDLAPVKVTAEAGSGYTAPRTTTATKTDTPVRDVPQSITVITQQQMADQSVQNIADAVRYVPGVGMAQGEGNRETPIIRGNASTGDFFLDGVRDDVQYYRDLYNIERVEVLKGPNAMIFGRGGVGGLINRVSRVADWRPVRELSLQAGSFDNKRATLDVGQGLNEQFAVRLTGVYEDSGSYRDAVFVERKGVNPTLAWRAGENTLVTLGYEYFKDDRVADRGVPSLDGRPVKTDESTFFGDPKRSPTGTEVQMGNALVEHDFGNGLTLRNRTRYADYDKFYQNIFPGAVNGAAQTVSLSSYNNLTTRENLFNQTDLVLDLKTGNIEHTLLGGVELGRQDTGNRRLTGYFDSAFTQETQSVPLSNPRSDVPMYFKAKASDGDNAGKTTIAAVYVQDQVKLSPQWQLVAGLRAERFKVDFTDRRATTLPENRDIDSSDTLISPRLGVVYKPTEPLSIYASYSISYQPRAGDQLAALTLANSNLDPEKFTNIEVGTKLDISPDLTFTAAIYQLDRKDQAITDPDPNAPAGSLILVDGQRTSGIELALTGKVTRQWSVVGGYAYQDAEILSDQSASIREGATLGQVPKRTISLWNRYDLTPVWGAGLGVVNRSEMFAVTENTATPANNVKLEGYTRVDAALFWTFSERLGAQLNVENLLNKEYFANAHNNNNILPGSPLAARATVRVRF